MATGACGINCSVCRLHVIGLCSTCGSGRSSAAENKLLAQIRIFGTGCPILECAVKRKIEYCLRDCEEFPCNSFFDGPYPFSRSFLSMQRRRRKQVSFNSVGAWPESTPYFWERLKEKDLTQICRDSGAFLLDEENLGIKSLNELWKINIPKRLIYKISGEFGGEWDRQFPFLMLVYLAKSTSHSLSGEMVSPREILTAHDFFQGRYKLKTEELEEKLDGETFLKVATSLGGKVTQHGDVSVIFFIFPKLPVEYIFWEKDEEFPSRMNILLDRAMANIYPLDTTSILVNLLNQRILWESRK
ncbi:MAG: hypothetical protein DRG25_01680 [Deltaproteobacteria bacterium]|nr:MAG: hypothetical protein DRG25_01680 [Deltaproteobacteria bacterium]